MAFEYTDVPPLTYRRRAGKSIVSGSYNWWTDGAMDGAANVWEKELTVVPKTNQQYGGPPAPLTLFTKTPHFLRMPRTYGFRTCGVPQDVRTIDGATIDLTTNMCLRPYQTTAVRRVLTEFRRGKGYDAMIEACCGSGKTVMALNIVQQLGRKAMIVVHKEFLLEQWRERINAFLPTARVGLIQQQTRDVDDKDIVLCMLQTVLKQDVRAMVPDAGLIIVDECHHMAARCFSTLFQHMPPVSHRLGLSATLARGDGLERVVHWLCGNVVCRIRRRTTMTTTAVEVERLEYTPHWREAKKKTGQVLFVQTITRMVEDTVRTDCIVRCLRRLLEDADRHILVVSERRKHLEAIMAGLSDSVACVMYVGETSKRRKRAREENKETARVIFSTYQMSEEGLDIPSLNTLVLATPKRRLEQIVGRILRKKTETRPLVVDVVDQLGLFLGMAKRRFQYFVSMGYTILKN